MSGEIALTRWPQRRMVIVKQQVKVQSKERKVESNDFRCYVSRIKKTKLLQITWLQNELRRK